MRKALIYMLFTLSVFIIFSFVNLEHSTNDKVIKSTVSQEYPNSGIKKLKNQTSEIHGKFFAIKVQDIRATLNYQGRVNSCKIRNCNIKNKSKIQNEVIEHLNYFKIFNSALKVSRVNVFNNEGNSMMIKSIQKSGYDRV